MSEGQDRNQQQEAGSRRLQYPAHRVAGAVPAADVAAAIADLRDAGFAQSAIEVLQGDNDLQRFRQLAEAPGIWGAARRFALSLGADLDLARQAEDELAAGAALIEVLVDSEASKARARDILLRHGGHFINYFGTWTIETLA